MSIAMRETPGRSCWYKFMQDGPRLLCLASLRLIFDNDYLFSFEYQRFRIFLFQIKKFLMTFLVETSDTVTQPLVYDGSPVESKPTNPLFGPRVQMILLLTVGIILTVLHHILYRKLNRRPVGSPGEFASQGVITALGNLIAYSARVALAAVIGNVFVQLLWSHLRRQSCSIKQINGLVACSQSPFSPSSIPAWLPSTFVLAFVAVLATLMAAISIFAPGALTVMSSDTALSEPCTVSAPNLGNGNLASAGNEFGNPISQTVAYASRIVVQGSYLPPMSLCNGSCLFDIDFLAPALNCTNTTTSVDFNNVLPYSDQFNTVWSSSYTFDQDALILQVAFRASQPQAVTCTAFNATYRARIQQINSSSTIAVLGVPQLHNPLSTRALGKNWLGLDALAAALARVVNGSAVYDASSYNWRSDTNVIAYTWIVKAASIYADVQLMSVLPSLMENISLSIASGYLDIPNYPPTMTSYDTTCYYPALQFSYNSRRLFVTYGAGIFVTVICVLFGLHAIHTNNAEESLDFSRLLAAILNGQLHLASRRTPITDDTRLKVMGSGQFHICEGKIFYYVCTTMTLMASVDVSA
jgi:hypothetical protein